MWIFLGYPCLYPPKGVRKSSRARLCAFNCPVGLLGILRRSPSENRKICIIPCSSSKYPLINTPLIKGQFSNVDLWIFQNSNTTDDFFSDALNTPQVKIQKNHQGGFRTNYTVSICFYYFILTKFHYNNQKLNYEYNSISTFQPGNY